MSAVREKGGGAHAVRALLHPDRASHSLGVGDWPTNEPIDARRGGAKRAPSIHLATAPRCVPPPPSGVLSLMLTRCTYDDSTSPASAGPGVKWSTHHLQPASGPRRRRALLLPLVLTTGARGAGTTYATTTSAPSIRVRLRPQTCHFLPFSPLYTGASCLFPRVFPYCRQFF